MSRGFTPKGIAGIGCAMMLANVALFIGGVAVIAYAVKWIIS